MHRIPDTSRRVGKVIAERGKFHRFNVNNVCISQVITSSMT